MMNSIKKYNTPKVSVIIATSDNAAHIEECMNSVLSQSLKEIEVIVIDVCSRDGTKRILRDYAAADSRVKFMADSFMSLGHAKNIAMDHAVSPYIIFLEPDDILYEDMLLEQSRRLDENPENDLCSYETDSLGSDSFGRTHRDKHRRMISANIRDKRKQETDSRLIRSFMFDNITMYRASFLRDSNIRHYELPGYGSQDTAFKFLSMSKGKIFVSAEIKCLRYLNKDKHCITDAKAVTDICNEFKYLKEILVTDRTLFQNMRLVFWQAYYDRNMLLYEKLSGKLRCRLSKQMQADINRAIMNKEYNREHFDISVRDEMELLLMSADEFDRFQADKIKIREEAMASDPITRYNCGNFKEAL